MKRCAFVAGGGGTKSYAFHVGVLRAMEEHGFVRKRHSSSPPTPDEGQRGDYLVDTFIGSSAGACAAAAAAFFRTIDEMEALIGIRPPMDRPPLTRKILLRRPKLWPPWKIAGLSNARGVSAYLKEVMPRDSFTSIEPSLYVVATQLNGRRKVIFGPKDSGAHGDYNREVAYVSDVPISEAIAASITVPIIFEPYSIANQHSGESIDYVDGEVRDTLSVHIAQDAQVDLAVSSNTWMPYSYTPTIGSVAQRGLLAVFNQTIIQTVQQKIAQARRNYARYDMLLEFLETRARNIGMPEPERLELKSQVAAMLNYHPVDEIFVEPDPDDAEFNFMSSWSFDPDNLRFAAERGYTQGTAAIERWKNRLPPPRTGKTSIVSPNPTD